MTLRSRFPLALAALPSVALAQSNAADSAGGMLQVLLGLGVVLALMFGSLWLLKRLSAPRGSAAGLVRVITAAAVGARERVVVVEVGDTWLVLGVAPGRVTTLHQLPRRDLPPAGPLAGGEFAERLRNLLGRPGGTP